jgi:hypothetical protein
MFPPLMDATNDALADDICGVSAHIAAAQAELAAKAARFDATGAWGEGGIRSCPEFLSVNEGLDLGSRHDLISVGSALNRLPVFTSSGPQCALPAIGPETTAAIWGAARNTLWRPSLLPICTGGSREEGGAVVRIDKASATDTTIVASEIWLISSPGRRY